MIQGMFGDLELASVQISELKKQQQLSINQPIKQQSRQSQIFQQNIFQIEIQRPNFDSIQLNHPLLSMDLHDILNSKFFESNVQTFSKILNKNQQYLNEYSIQQDYQVAVENRVDQKQIVSINAQIKSNKHNMISQKDQFRQTNITNLNQEKIISEYQKQNSSCYPFLNPKINQDSQNNTLNINEIINFFKQNNYQVDASTIQFYIDAYETKDPLKLLELYKANKSR
ncbi:unnamed protein product [Paramecium pentaurelia]|uniref:Uncharacterized protein n=1 Tax=Paramecium pentaurelia TaxID=43138 RepID=A0A8S1UCH6_9CILI|nr:unnamed protein product [Paramecium pentaurelia]